MDISDQGILEILRTAGAARTSRAGGHEGFLRLINSGKLAPRLLSMRREDDRILLKGIDERRVIPVDRRLQDAFAIFCRFQPAAVDLTNAEEVRAGFISWLENRFVSLEELTSDDLGDYLLIPLGVSEGEHEDLIYQKIAILPQPLYRLGQLASVGKLLDDPWGQRTDIGGTFKSTSQVLWDDTEAVVIGCSVGSQIAEALAMLGIQTMTIVDDNDYDEVVQGRMLFPNIADHGMQKVVKTGIDLLKAHPRLNLRPIVGRLTPENAAEIIQGQNRGHPHRKLVICEEVDDESAKRLVRKVCRAILSELRQQFSYKPDVLLVMISDEGRTCVGVHVEVVGEDDPFNGAPLRFFPENPLAEGLPRPVSLVALTGISQGPDDKHVGSLDANDVGAAPEILAALERVFRGEISSFEQSGLAARQAGVVAAAAVIAWLEGHLSKTGRSRRVDVSRLLDDRYERQEYLERAVTMNKAAEEHFFGKSLIHLG